MYWLFTMCQRFLIYYFISFSWQLYEIPIIIVTSLQERKLNPYQRLAWLPVCPIGTDLKHSPIYYSQEHSVPLGSRFFFRDNWFIKFHNSRHCLVLLFLFFLLFSLLPLFCFLLLLRQGLAVQFWLFWNMQWSPGYLQTHRDLPAFVFWVLWWNLCTTWLDSPF